MIKKHKLLTILLCIALCVTLAFSLIACDIKDEDKSDKTDSGKVIANGNFELTSTDAFPKSPTSWKGVAGNTSGDNAVDSDSKTLVSGVVDVNNTTYNKSKRAWDKLANPGKSSQVADDDNVLMIYNKKSTSYRYVSNDFSISSNKFYKISIDVRTDKIVGSGAYVGLGGDAFKYINIGDTNGNWTAVTFYLESSNLNSNNINVIIGNGTKGKNDGSLSKGYVFADNILVSEIEKADYDNTQEDAATRIYKANLKMSDSSFENVSLTGSNVYSPNLWSGVSTTAPTGTDYIEKGIVDLSETRPEFIPNSITALGSDSKLLVLNNKKRTAYGYRSSKRLRIETGKYYKVTVNVATFINEADLSSGSTPNASDAGAYIRLKTGTSAEDIVIGGDITGINTNSEWLQVSFYIQGDQIRNKDYYIELGLGNGEKDDPLLITGKAFFDEISLTAIDESVYTGLTADKNNIKLSVDGGPVVNEINDANTTPSTFFGRDEVAYTDSGIDYKGETIVSRDTTNWQDTWGSNPLVPNKSLTNVTVLKNTQPTANIYSFNKSKFIQIAPNGYYRLSLWVKTTDIIKDKGLNVSLYSYDSKKANEQPDLEMKDLITQLATIEKINTRNIKDHVTASYNDYAELSFYIEGDVLMDKNIYLQLSLGSGSFMEATKHVLGTAYIADVTFYPVLYSDYNSAESGSYTKKHSFKTANASIQNGDFDDVNKQSTLNVYSKNDKDFALDFANGYLDNTFGVPSNWTSSDESYLRSSINGGIFNINSTTLKKFINDSLIAPITFDNNFYRGFESSFPTGTINTTSNANMMVIGSKNANSDYVITESTKPSVCGCVFQTCINNGYCKGEFDGCAPCAHKAYNGTVKPWGYTSPSISLSADSYYVISVWAKVVEGDATISLKTSTKDQTQSFVINSTSHGTDWNKYDFYIQTGFDSTSATLDLYLGDKNQNLSDNSGTVFFDMPKSATVSENEYDNAVKATATNNKLKTSSYTVITFDNVTTNTDALDTPVGWTGAHRDDDSPKEERDIVSGVYNIDHGNRTHFGKGDATNRIEEATLEGIFVNDNDNALVINNNVATEYAYTYKLSKSLAINTHYMFSIDVLTQSLTDADVANITLKLQNTSYSFSLNDERGVKVNTNGAWRTYYFFVQTPDKLAIDNATIILGLGDKDKDNYVKGYAFFDNVNVAKITEAEFPAESKPDGTATEDDYKYDNSITHRIVFTNDDVTKEEPATPDNDNPYLWLYITTGIIGGLLFIVIGYYLIKKLYKKYGGKKKRVTTSKGKESYNRNRVAPIPTNDPNRKKTSDKFKD